MAARLRQVVLASSELAPVAGSLREALGLGEPYADPGVREFGLENAVFALGDRFIEVVTPTLPGTAAGRHLERRGGDSGYMVIFQLDDLEAARARVREAGIRVVWQVDLPDISGTHLHPADMRGAIVSLDRAEPPGSWRWGGPDWTGREGRGAPGRLTGAVIEVADPGAVAARWAHVLGAGVGDGPVLELDGAPVAFREGPDGGLVEISVALPGRPAGTAEIGGVRFTITEEGRT